jgi:hypothetical protein
MRTFAIGTFRSVRCAILRMPGSAYSVFGGRAQVYLGLLAHASGERLLRILSPTDALHLSTAGAPLVESPALADNASGPIRMPSAIMTRPAPILKVESRPILHIVRSPMQRYVALELSQPADTATDGTREDDSLVAQFLDVERQFAARFVLRLDVFVQLVEDWSQASVFGVSVALAQGKDDCAEFAFPTPLLIPSLTRDESLTGLLLSSSTSMMMMMMLLLLSLSSSFLVCTVVCVLLCAHSEFSSVYSHGTSDAWTGYDCWSSDFLRYGRRHVFLSVRPSGSDFV